MAKRGDSKGGVVIAQEILALVTANNEIKGPEVMANLRERFPKVTFNENSVQVAFANARKKLGLSRTLVKRPIGAGSASPIGRRSNSAARSGGITMSGSTDMARLEAARDLLKLCNGDASAAQSALSLVASLQMN